MTSRYMSVIVPAFNEALVIKRTLTELLEMAPEVVSRVIVVNDGSTDGMGDLLRSISNETPYLEVLEHLTNRGFGAAIATGLSQVNSGYVAWLPADGAIDPSALRLVDAISDSVPALFGFRQESWVGKRRFVSAGVSNSVKVLFGVDLTNFSGFFIGEASYLRRLPLLPQSTFFTWQVAIRSHFTMGQLHRSEILLRPKHNSERTSRAFRLSSLGKGMVELISLWAHIRILRRMRPSE